MREKSNKNISRTQTYSSSDSDKTQSYETQIESTQSYRLPDGVTQTYDQIDSGLTDKTVEHNLGKGDEIELNQKKYRIIEIITGDKKTGEAVIYKIKDSENKIYCLKLYFYFTDPKHEPNPEALNRIKKIDDPDILKLHDFGTREKKYQNKFCFEISDFAEGGDLLSFPNLKQKYTPEFIRSEVIPQLFKGIRRLHQYKIFHCDLKPQNVLYLDKEQRDLVIGDYGSAKTFEESSEKELSFTSIVKGTNLYRAPEQSDCIVSQKNDKYTFGMIVFHLLYPQFVNQAEWRKIVERRAAGKPILDFDPQYDNLNNLIAGLTLQDYNRRWGKNEVESWLAGKSVEVHYQADAEIVPIKLGQVTIKTASNLVAYIEKNKDWYDNLIEDREGYGTLLSWIMSLKDLEHKKIFDRVVRFYQQDGKEYVKEAIIRYFQPSRPVKVDMKTYHLFDSRNVSQECERFFEHLDDLWKITDLMKIKFYLFQFEFCLRQLAETASGNLKLQIQAILEKISAVLKIAPKADFADYQTVIYPKITDELLVELFYAFHPQRRFKDPSNKGYDTIEEVGLFFAGHENLFSDTHIQSEKLVFLHKHDLDSLINLSYNKFLFSLLQDHVKSEIHFANFLIKKPDKQHNSVVYKLGKSLTDYFQQNGINNNLTEISKKDESMTLPQNFFLSASSIYQEVIVEIEKKHQIKEHLISPSSKEQFLSSLKKKIREYRINEIKTRTGKFLEVTRIPYLLKSFAFLLPLFTLLLLAIGFGMKSEPVIRFLSRLSPFPLTFVDATLDGAFYRINASSISLLLLISLFPALIVTFIKRKFQVSKSAQKTLLVMAILLVINGIGYVLFSHKLLLLSLEILAGILGMIIGITVFIWLFKLLHFSTIFLLAGPIIISQVGEVRHEAYGYAIIGYSIVTALLLLSNVIYFYKAQGRFYFLPFLLSLIGYAAISTPFINLSALTRTTTAVQTQIHPQPLTLFGTINSPAVNIRSAPSPNSSVIDQAVKGEQVLIINKTGDWYQVRYHNKDGYIYHEFINLKSNY